jgi:hypothetical protein
MKLLPIFAMAFAPSVLKGDHPCVVKTDLESITEGVATQDPRTHKLSHFKVERERGKSSMRHAGLFSVFDAIVLKQRFEPSSADTSNELHQSSPQGFRIGVG